LMASPTKDKVIPTGGGMNSMHGLIHSHGEMRLDFVRAPYSS